ncbi:MAG: CsbD family protein [Acidobacteriota bacterium]
MGLPNKAEVRGKIKKAKGTVKEKVGHAVGNRRMENDGVADRSKGSVQETVGKARRKVGDAVKDLGNTLRK